MKEKKNNTTDVIHLHKCENAKAYIFVYHYDLDDRLCFIHARSSEMRVAQGGANNGSYKHGDFEWMYVCTLLPYPIYMKRRAQIYVLLFFLLMKSVWIAKSRWLQMKIRRIVCNISTNTFYSKSESFSFKWWRNFCWVLFVNVPIN